MFATESEFGESSFDLLLKGFVDIPILPIPTSFDFGSREFNFLASSSFEEDEDIGEIQLSHSINDDLWIGFLDDLFDQTLYLSLIVKDTYPFKTIELR
jgi:hypothetical protein